jgi:hypothetical protein
MSGRGKNIWQLLKDTSFCPILKHLTGTKISLFKNNSKKHLGPFLSQLLRHDDRYSEILVLHAQKHLGAT